MTLTAEAPARYTVLAVVVATRTLTEVVTLVPSAKAAQYTRPAKLAGLKRTSSAMVLRVVLLVI